MPEHKKDPLEDYCMSFEQAVEYFNNGGNQDTLFCWMLIPGDDKPHFSPNMKDIEDLAAKDMRERSIRLGFKYYAAPIIKTELTNP